MKNLNDSALVQIIGGESIGFTNPTKTPYYIIEPGRGGLVHLAGQPQQSQTH